MALEGKLSEFTLEEILQLISLQQKTGVLNVEASYPMVLYFEGGELLSIRDRRGAGEDPLVQYLKRYGFFTGENWDHLDFIQRNSDLDFTEILLNEGHLSEEQLLRVQHDTAQEHIFRGMQLNDGRYHFTSGSNVLKGVKGRVRIKVEGLLMEAARRIDEIDSLRERYPSGNTKIRPGDGEVVEEAMSDGMRHIFSLVGSETSLSRLISQGKMSEFDCYQTLEMLREAKLVQIAAKPAAPPPEPSDELDDEEDDAGTQGRRAPLLWAMASLALIIGFLLLSPVSPYSIRSGPGTDRYEAFSQQQAVARIQAALQIYRETHGNYPSKLAELSDEGVLPSDFDLTEHPEMRYQQRNGGRSYALTAERGTDQP